MTGRIRIFLAVSMIGAMIFGGAFSSYAGSAAVPASTPATVPAVSPATTPAAVPATMAKAVKQCAYDNMMLIAHRGTPEENPEHSIAGYRQAVDYGAVYIEQDVAVSKDGVLFVSHGNNLKKTTGKNLNITTNTAKTLDKVKLKNGEKLPRLSEVFDTFGDSVFYVIETKLLYGNAAKVMDKEFVRLIRKYHLEKKVMLQSSNVDSLKRVHKQLKTIPYMYLIFPNVSKTIYPKRIKALPSFVDFVGLPTNNISAGIRKTIHNKNMKLAAYTVIDDADMDEAVSKKVDAVFTNDIEMSLEYNTD